TTDVNGDGISDLMWRDPGNTSLVYWLMNGATAPNTGTLSVGPAWQVAHVGDTSGDGRGDIVWINESQLAVSTSAGTSFVTTMISNPRPAGLRVVGGGDINGDGKSDLVWRNAANTTMTYWLMNNNAVIGTGTISIGPVWTVANVGDINGDGLADIIWVNGTQVAASLSQGVSFNTVMVGSALPAGYRAMGGGDINGDGRSDLVWRNASNTTTLYWLMNGATVQSTGTLAIGSNWELAFVGDISGDKRADLVWLNDTQVAASQSEGTSFATYIVNRARPAGWRIVNNQ
ncbi:MAG: FG-GAP repeat domain-containing protein, partial [Pseudoxanthomonas sp.]